MHAPPARRELARWEVLAIDPRTIDDPDDQLFTVQKHRIPPFN